MTFYQRNTRVCIGNIQAGSSNSDFAPRATCLGPHLKRAIAIAISAILWRTPYSIWWIFGALGLSLTLHFFWRWKPGGTISKHNEVTCMRFASIVFESPESGASSY
jgi:hypothetical protein